MCACVCARVRVMTIAVPNHSNECDVTSVYTVNIRQINWKGKQREWVYLADCVCEGAYCVISRHTPPSTQTCLKTEKSLGQLNHRLLSLTIRQACLLLFSIFCQVFVFLYLLFSIHHVCCYVCISLVHYLAALNKLFQTSVACCFLNSKKNGRGENREEKKERTITERECDGQMRK